MQDHILVVEDDEETRNLLKAYLERNGCTVSTARDGPAMWQAVTAHPVDLVVMDIMLPGEDGLTLCRNLRSHRDTLGIPVVMLTARGDETDRIVGLEMGADDYLAKPFNPRELLARINSVLRRAREMPPEKRIRQPERLRFAGWTLEVKAQQLTAADGLLVPLTRGEFNLLMIFLQHPNEILDRDRITELHQNREATVYDRSVDVQIGRLRRRLRDDPKKPGIIKTIWGKGYMLACQVELL